jgi:hypothetical protein
MLGVYRYDIRQGALVVLPANAAGMAFNCDSSLLAIWSASTVHVYSVQALTNSGTLEVAYTWVTLDSSIVTQVTFAFLCHHPILWFYLLIKRPDIVKPGQMHTNASRNMDLTRIGPS